MAYGNLKTHSIPCLYDYATALRRWENTAPLRGDKSGKRPLAERSSKRAMWMLRYGDDIAVRHWNTDLLVYRPDGSIEIRPYSSKTSSELCNAVLPSGIRCSFTASLGTMVRIGGYRGRGYVVPARCVVRNGEMVSGSAPIRSPRIDPKRAREALKATRFYDFVTWAKAIDAMNGIERPEWHTYYQHGLRYDCRTICDLLADPEQWGDIYRFAGENLAQVIETTRMAVYRCAGNVVVHDEIPFVSSYDEERAVRNRQMTYAGF